MVRWLCRVHRHLMTLGADELKVDPSHFAIDRLGLLTGGHAKPAILSVQRLAGGDRAEKNIVHIGHIIQPTGNEEGHITTVA